MKGEKKQYAGGLGAAKEMRDEREHYGIGGGKCR
jgi:hypothetical protein